MDATQVIHQETQTHAALAEPEGYRSVSEENRADLFILTALIVYGSGFGLICGFHMQCLWQQWLQKIHLLSSAGLP